jgi:hypothetical protein
LIVKVEQVRTPARIVMAAFMTSSICLGSLTGLLALSQFWVLGAIMIWIAWGERWFAEQVPSDSFNRAGGKARAGGSHKAAYQD